MWQPIGGTDISGEWHRTGGYYRELKRGKYNHNYICTIKENSAFKFGERGWRAFVDMGTRCMNMGNLLDKKFNTLQEARSFVMEYVKSFDVSQKATEMVEQYKLEHCSPMFDLDFNYVGDDYLGTICYKNRKDYFNDNPADYEGTHYVLKLYQDKLCLGTMKCFPCVQGYDSVDNEELALQLLEKTCEIPSKYYDRYRKYKEELCKI